MKHNIVVVNQDENPLQVAFGDEKFLVKGAVMDPITGVMVPTSQIVAPTRTKNDLTVHYKSGNSCLHVTVPAKRWNKWEDMKVITVPSMHDRGKHICAQQGKRGNSISLKFEEEEEVYTDDSVAVGYVILAILFLLVIASCFWYKVK